jgi:hypothetical protein
MESAGVGFTEYKSPRGEKHGTNKGDDNAADPKCGLLPRAPIDGCQVLFLVHSGL